MIFNIKKPNNVHIHIPTFHNILLFQRGYTILSVSTEATRLKAVVLTLLETGKKFFPVALFFLFLLPACHQSRQEVGNEETVRIGSLDELMALFDRLNYTQQSWDAGNREVPRIIFDRVGEHWRDTSKNIPVALKKQIFFRLMAPLLLVANENILAERRLVRDAHLDDPKLKALAVKYKISSDPDAALTEKQRQQLLLRVDTLPPSLVLAQAAEESGWGSSRFTIEGNAFFGQWDFSGKGMVPKQQRKKLGDYRLARFDSPLASVEGYMLNLNTNQAYRQLRELRARLRAEGKPMTGIELAGTLDKYSERGQAYIDGLRKMIRFNKLGPVDEAYLSDDHVIRLLVRSGS